MHLNVHRHSHTAFTQVTDKAHGFLVKYMYSMFSFGKTITSSGKEGLHNGKLSKHITFDISTMYMKV